ncbi:MAG: biotin transporter BioY [Spirochaetia bacterium]|jgi:biotin transport system substrate-specific component
MSSHLVADTLRPDGSRLAWLYDTALVAGFSLVVALSAQVAIPLPFTPVPVTLQTLAVLLAGCLLGSGRGALAVLAYIGEGAAGLPVFSGGRGGFVHLLGPTGGYLLGFLAAAYIVGFLAERGTLRSWPGTLLTLVLGNVILYIPGVIWLGAYTGMDKAVQFGFLPFLAGDVLKIAAGWGLLSGVAAVREKSSRGA